MERLQLTAGNTVTSIPHVGSRIEITREVEMFRQYRVYRYVMLVGVAAAVAVMSALGGSAVAQTAADADFDGSGEVDFNDFLEFAAAWKKSVF